MRIKEVHAREILDSRGYPTVEVEVTLEGGVTGRASVPAPVRTKHWNCATGTGTVIRAGVSCGLWRT